MRGLYLFVAGALVGSIVQIAVAQNQNQNQGIVGINHVGISVPDLDEALAYYTGTMGFPEAFRIVGETGQVALIYVQVSRNTFVELQQANADRPPGITHFGVHVENMAAVTEMFRRRGVDVPDGRVSSTRAVLSNIFDAEGIRMELLELPPESLHAQASERWE